MMGSTMESNEPALNRMPVSPEPAALRCPRCGRPMQPGQVFAGAAGLSGAAVCEGCGALLDLEPVGAAAEAAAPAVYEEKAVSCAPMDVDRVARAEAVDGWALHDTTVDDRAPDRIVAHFRRPLRVRAQPAGGGGCRARPVQSHRPRGTRPGASPIRARDHHPCARGIGATGRAAHSRSCGCCSPWCGSSASSR